MSQNHNQPRPPAPPQNRDGRDLGTRAADAREESWAPPDVLPEIKQEPGYSYRWIRTATYGEDDPLNVSRAFREKWSPVPLTEQPHMTEFNDPRAVQKGNVEIGGLMLCKCPDKFTKQRDAYYANRTRQEQIAIDNDLMKEQDARMPLFTQRKSKVSFGNGGT
jgi:hypothetical protein